MKEYLINNKKFRLNLFDIVDSNEKAYLIGYLAGDGGFISSTYKRKARLFVSSIDESIISYFKNAYCPDTVIKPTVPVNKTRNIKSNRLSYILTFSSKFEDTFNKFGVLSKKIDRKLVNIPKKYMKSYILGLFDADGTISFGRRKDRNRLWVNVQITHQSIDILSKIQSYLINELNIASSILKRKTENCLDLKFSNREHANTFLSWLYQDLPEMYSKVKYERAVNYLKEYNSCK